MGSFRRGAAEKATSQNPGGENVVDLSPRAPIAPSQPVDFDDEADRIELVAASHGYRSDAEPFKPKLRRRVVEEAQDVVTMQVRRSVVDKFDMWCAQNGFTKKAGFEDMVRRVTRRA